ncbi:MAG TPA: Asp-tRNA(Asn)/Glu-tRNA(Gln) amidotransferase subunit GatB [Actinomycetota bacterium]|nr:Asp-tRNA(Asn)/Glu-tRNA(Gln) amidotransferase subunit GatB [Actinomycetota bacterium]
MTAYESVIGLECHVELSTATKMFCGCRNAFGAPPNSNVCPVCLGLPGSLPVPNEAAIAAIVRIGLALECAIAPDSLFHRKNYFYPDMPKDFQISQYDLPICVGGHLDIEVDGRARTIGITRVHMEEDTGKTTHVGATGRIGSADHALVDYNRAGVPLVECVSEPDLRTPEEARAYLTELRATLQALAVSDVRMEEGSLRCDANISTRRIGETTFGTKVEIKNLNSIRSLERALRFEEERQRTMLDRGETITQETRHFDEERGSTHTLRSKEEAFDYRYFPEPDLPPLAPDGAWVAAIRDGLPELPAAKRARFATEFGIREEVARILTGSMATSRFYEETVALGADPKASANWITQDVAALANKARVDDLDATALTPGHVAQLIALVADGTVSQSAAKQALEEVFETGDAPAEVIERRGLRQVTDTSALEAWVDEAIAENASAVEQYRSGKEGALNAVLGAVMKRSRGSANAQAVREVLVRRLASD